MKNRRRLRCKHYHGEVPEDLLRTLGATMAAHGLEFVSLREAARRAGLSHAAYAYHFRNKVGLLSAFAAQGFRLLEEDLAHALAKAGKSASAGRSAVIKAYVGFALDHPEQFGLMFRSEQLNPKDRTLAAARDAVFSTLARGIGGGEKTVTTAWAVAHGLATLWVSGMLSDGGRSKRGAARVEAAVALVTAALSGKSRR